MSLAGLLSNFSVGSGRRKAGADLVIRLVTTVTCNVRHNSPHLRSAVSL